MIVPTTLGIWRLPTKTEWRSHLKLLLLSGTYLFIHSFLQLGDINYYFTFKFLDSWCLPQIQPMIKLRMKNYQGPVILSNMSNMFYLVDHNYCHFSSIHEVIDFKLLILLSECLALLYFYLYFWFCFLCHLGMSKLWLARLALTQFSAKILHLLTSALEATCFQTFHWVLLWDCCVLTSFLTLWLEPQSAPQCCSAIYKCFHY